MESFLENPVSKLNLGSLGFRHLLVVLWVYFNLSAKLDKFFNCFLIFGENKSVANILRNPVLFSPSQVCVNLLIIAFEALSELFLLLRCHLTATAAFREASRLLNFLYEELTIL